MNRIYNFGAGPAVLPVPVLEEAARGVLELEGSGMSVLEISHRSSYYERINAEAQERLLRLMGLSPENFSAMFLGGGASLQFAMLPMNFLKPGATADYVDTGEWATRAIKEARRFGEVNVAASSEAGGFSYIPKDLRRSADAAYLHITTNNTIEGTEWPDLPAAGDTALIGDISSDIFARDVQYNRFHLMYAGAQKNAGPAGVTLVVARKSYIEAAKEGVPTMLSYRTHAKANSLYNTPPVFAVYVVGLVLKWIEAEGGLTALEARNREKAAIVYDALEASPAVYEPTVTDRADRSLMNVTFRMRTPDLDKEFLAGAAEHGMAGLKGHRSVGGFRASLYNAFPEAGCRALADYLYSFAEKHPG